MYKLHLGSNKEVLKDFADNSIDSIVTDPPYELGFMGKSWDSTGIAYDVELWKECLRVLKPGGHILAFSGTRTYHRMACAIEDAGFEVRDMIEWVYGSGFPKSLNIGKAVDKLQGNERETYLAPIAYPDSDCWGKPNSNSKGNDIGFETQGTGTRKDMDGKGNQIKTKGSSEWEGWGTALKPAHEPICMARKPLAEKTVAENVLKWGTGGINIDESRVEHNEPEVFTNRTAPKSTGEKMGMFAENGKLASPNQSGRFPANLIHDNSEEVRECFPETKTNSSGKGGSFGAKNPSSINLNGEVKAYGGDSGNASRFFKAIIYEAKASKAERNRGCEAVFNLFEQSEGLEFQTKIFRPGEGLGGQQIPAVKQNHHPTVKPIALMEYLIKMVTPKGGVVLDPFNGSGSTGCAAVKNGFDYHGIDITEEYITISEKRIKAY